MSLEQPLCWYTDEGTLRFYLISVGEGLMTLIVSNEVVMLFDCNVTNDNEDEVLAFLDKVIPKEYNDDSKSMRSPYTYLQTHIEMKITIAG